MNLHETFVTDSQGNKVAVMLPINEYEALLKALDEWRSLKKDFISDEKQADLEKALAEVFIFKTQMTSSHNPL